MAKRTNMTLNECSRCITLHAGLPKILWTDTINIAEFLVNWGLSTPLNGSIHEEWKIGKFIFSEVFHCVSYVHVDLITRTKILNTGHRNRIGWECFHIGYWISRKILGIRANIKRSHQNLYIMNIDNQKLI